jgi:uncharacterized phage-like protein YoqJ
MFTGHRRIPRNHISSIYQYLYQYIHAAHESGCLDFYAGGAIGFDRMAGAAVLEYKKTYPDVKLHLLLPCKDQDAHWPKKEQEAFRAQLALADSVTYLAEEYYYGCMKARNQALVDHARYCIAYATELSGGTVQTISLAKRAGLTVINIGKKITGDFS